MQEIELLAPAGSYEVLEAAVQNGANAIYLGGNEFSARAYATNFTREELQAASAYCHLRNVKLYVTVNTLYQDNQFNELEDYLSFLASIKIDALIIQDIGLMELVKKYYPQFDIHMSTQTSVRNLEGVLYFEKQGVDRVVLARENSIQEITNICKNSNVEVEVFVHGALCMSYSGQCLMSSMIAKRSGNKGACGQPCRLNYKLQLNGKSLDQEPSYLLSPKDLCSIEQIGNLIDSGITSFKIEGRMKRPEYVAVITKQYRQAIDAYLSGKKLHDLETRITKMKQMFNRGFTGGHLLNDRDFLAKDYPGNRGLEVGHVVNYDTKKKRVKIKLKRSLKQGDRIDFKDLDYTRTVTKLFLDDRLINRGNINDIVEIELNQSVKAATPVYKVIDIELLDEAHTSYQKENIANPLSMTFVGKLNQAPVLTISYQDKEVRVVSNQLVEAATKTPLDPSRIEQQLVKLGNTVFSASKVTIDFSKNSFFSIKGINEMRRQAIDLLNQEITKTLPLTHQEIILQGSHQNKTIEGICVRVYTMEQLLILIDQDITHYYFPLNKQLTNAISLAKEHGKKIIPFTGFLSNEKDMKTFKASSLYNEIDDILVGDYGAKVIFSDKNCILDTNFNLYNSYALNYFKDYETILSLEMSKKQINSLINVKQKITSVVYGKTINMYLKHCLISEHYFGFKKKNCGYCKKGQYQLIDRKGEAFAIMSDDCCNNYLFNSHVLQYNDIKDLEVDYILLSFSDENAKITKLVFEYYQKVLNHSDKKIEKLTFSKYTNAYFND